MEATQQMVINQIKACVQSGYHNCVEEEIFTYISPSGLLLINNSE